MLNKNTIAEVILDFQKEELPQVSPRILQVDLELPLKRATTILGPRRSGKTINLCLYGDGFCQTNQYETNNNTFSNFSPDSRFSCLYCCMAREGSQSMCK